MLHNRRIRVRHLHNQMNRKFNVAKVNKKIPSEGEDSTTSRTMAISRFSRTITLITQYEPNIKRPQKRVYVLMPSSSKFSNPTMPNDAQKSDCDDSNKLKTNRKKEKKVESITLDI